MRQHILLMLLSFAVLTAHIEAQDYQISFAGRGASSTVESVEVQNLTQNTSITLTEGQILHLKGVATNVNNYVSDKNNMIIYPNPITDIGYVEFTSEYSEKYIFSLYDLMGRKVLSNSFFLEKGNHQFVISGLKQGTYLLNLHSSNYSKSGKIICLSLAGGREHISYVGQSTKKMKTVKLKGSTSDNLIEMQYNEGDRLLLTASSGIYKTVKSIVPKSSSLEVFFLSECRDRNGNNYKVVKIGEQVWMAENLKSTHFANGVEIPLVIGNTNWANLSDYITDKAYCFFNNNESLGYGALYTYAAATNGKPHDGINNVQGVCPRGWHLPSDAEWYELENTLANNGHNFDGTTGGGRGKIAKALASVYNWNNSNGLGCVGNNILENNSSGFSANAGGYRDYAGSFYGVGDRTRWWSSSSTNTVRQLETGAYYMSQYASSNKLYGFSVRCVKNENYIVVNTPYSGEKWERGSSKTILWDTNISSNTDVKIELWNSVNLEDIITYSTENTGEFTWNIPHDLNIGDEYKIRILSSSTEYIIDETSGYFSVVEQSTSSVQDYEGNVYPTVKIGEQWWMAENLKSTQYADGTTIPNITGTAGWANLNDNNSDKAYCFYNNDESLGYGVLYTYAAATNGNISGSNVQGICPIGWHLPSSTEWRELENYLGFSGYNYDGTIGVGSKVGKAMAGTFSWNNSEVNGHIGWNQSTNNTSGFKALACGYRTHTGEFYGESNWGSWWTADQVNSSQSQALKTSMYYKGVGVGHSGDFMSIGLSVRCVKDNDDFINVTYPLGGEEWETGTIQKITWDTNISSIVRVELWSTSGQEIIIASKVNNVGEYCWRIPFNITIGDDYEIRIISDSNDVVYGESESAFSIQEPPTGSVQDYEGNVYPTVKIGEQWWMAENLKSTQYADGTTIPNITGTTGWANLNDNNTDKAYCFYNNDESLGYGVLYTYAAATNGNISGSNVQGICPIGWHLPSDTEWNELVNYLADNGYNYDGSYGGGSNRIGKAMASSSGWYPSGNLGDVGNRPSNSSRFSGKASGFRSFNSGSFGSSSFSCLWWSSSQSNSTEAYYRALDYDKAFLAHEKHLKSSGFSVRCIRNEGDFITITSPNGEDEWIVGNTYTINWQSNISSEVRIELWVSTRMEMIIASAVNNNGEYSWEIPQDLTYGSEYKIRITSVSDESVYDESENFFSIIEPIIGTVTDIEGNIYKAVRIGSQWWMAENLKVTKDRDGQYLLHPDTALDWYNLTVTDKAYCYYNNNNNGEAEKYGALYTYEAAMSSCPAGWHLPSDEEWDELIKYVGQVGYEGEEALALCSASGWNGGSGTDKFGFGALPGASRSGFDASFYGEGSVGYWLSSTIEDETYVRMREIHLISNRSMYSYKKGGYSVRCVKD